MVNGEWSGVQGLGGKLHGGGREGFSSPCRVCVRERV
jgi:hypothetical protein